MNSSHPELGYRAPAERKSQHAQIVRNLGMQIVAGKLKPHERLPTEASLCAAYNVSRPVLREATRVLVAKGLVVSKQKAGAIVRPKSEWHLLDPDVLYWSIQGMPQQDFVETLFTVRRIFEPATAALAATVASDASIAAIAEAYAGMEAATTPEELIGPDLAFHRRIAEATGNDILAYIANMLSLALRESITLSNRHPNTHALSLPMHKAILTAIANHDPDAAHQATVHQLRETSEDLPNLIGAGINSA